ncbi:hypothetical protein AXF42_Ash008400 [Apostasia shenzhenica]|uniref:Uncharacterized protein n=1 Tax=Apostasia shenzhenica TaxID=1088818 RepID=A0A2I0AXR7_9ASPA|nr:hypothetical protein AXF42_Ash008400 [Apostasia shenzhenica]
MGRSLQTKAYHFKLWHWILAVKHKARYLVITTPSRKGWETNMGTENKSLRSKGETRGLGG